MNTFNIAKVFTIENQQVVVMLAKNPDLNCGIEENNYNIHIQGFFIDGENITPCGAYGNLDHFYKKNRKDTWAFAAQKALENVTEQHAKDFIDLHFKNKKNK